MGWSNAVHPLSCEAGLYEAQLFALRPNEGSITHERASYVKPCKHTVKKETAPEHQPHKPSA